MTRPIDPSNPAPRRFRNTARPGDVIVRLYESGGNRATARLTAGFPLAGAVSTDLLERRWSETEEYVVADNGVTLALRPFEIRTLRMSPS